MLDKTQKENWLKALRSGEYEQTKGRLFDPEFNAYCCIGVFAKCNDIPVDETGHHMLDSGGENCGYMHLTNQIEPSEVDKLWGMNDKDELSFEEIADYIEQNL